MATTVQRQKLRRKLQDMYDKDGKQLTNTLQTFTDDELDELLEEGVSEATEGTATTATASTEDLALGIMLGRADGILMLAQDEGRRKKWEINNEIIDDTGYPKILMQIAREIRLRYESHQNRKLKKVLENHTVRPTGGGLFRFNDGIPLNVNHKFINRDTRRNTPLR